MIIYAIDFNTVNFGPGVAIVSAENPKKATQYLRAWGKLNATPNEYLIESIVEITKACAQDAALIYENLMISQEIVPIIPEKYFKEITRVTPYLYNVLYDNIDYEYAEQFFKKTLPLEGSYGCSAIRSGNFFGRNLDWYYNNSVEFVIRTSRKNNRIASIGVAGGINSLTPSVLENNTNLDEFRILPFYTLDGINECGVFCNTNVVPIEGAKTTTTVPEKKVKRTLCSKMLPRFILDTFTSATEAVNFIKDYVSVYIANDIQDLGYEVHYLIGDSQSTYVLEFSENKNIVLEHNKITNFRIEGVRFNSNGTVYTQETSTENVNPVDSNNITPYGSGLERYNKLATAENTTTKEGMRTLMDSIKYTNTYKEDISPFWYSEFTNKDFNISLTTPINNTALQTYISRAKEKFNTRSRNNPVTWHTVHSSVYDIENQVLYLKTQEDNAEYTFRII